ncbi:MAG: hypothetical protein ACKO7W_16555 [Elainella sp.]
MATGTGDRAASVICRTAINRRSGSSSVRSDRSDLEKPGVEGRPKFAPCQSSSPSTASIP